jgi:hypothetical protein
VTRKQTRVIGQGEHLLLNALHKRFPIAAGEIGATNRASEDQVTAETDAWFRAERTAERLLRGL